MSAVPSGTCVGDERAAGARLRIVDHLARRVCTGAHHMPARSNAAAQCVIGRASKTSSSIATHASAFSRRMRMLAKRLSLQQLGPFDGAYQIGPVAVALQTEQPEPAAVAAAVAVDQRVGDAAAVVGRLDAAEAQARVDVPAHDVDAGAQQRGGRRTGPRRCAGARPAPRRCALTGGDRGRVIAHAAALLRRVGALRRQRRRRRRRAPRRRRRRRPAGRGRALRPVAGDAAVHEARIERVHARRSRGRRAPAR